MQKFAKIQLLTNWGGKFFPNCTIFLYRCRNVASHLGSLTYKGSPTNYALHKTHLIISSLNFFFFFFMTNTWHLFTAHSTVWRRAKEREVMQKTSWHKWPRALLPHAQKPQENGSPMFCDRNMYICRCIKKSDQTVSATFSFIPTLAGLMNGWALFCTPPPQR